MDNHADPYHTPEVRKKTPPSSNWRQVTSTQFNTYEAAREAYTASDAERKRVRRRAGGYFDFVIYERLPKPKKETLDEQLPEVQSGTDERSKVQQPYDQRTARRSRRKS